jgi:hypothetical protein
MWAALPQRNGIGRRSLPATQDAEGGAEDVGEAEEDAVQKGGEAEDEANIVDEGVGEVEVGIEIG